MYRTQKRLFLILVPLINVFNYYVTYPIITFSLKTALTFTLDTLEGYLAWWAVHSIIIYLDKRLPFETDTKKRLIVQLTTTTLAGMLIIIGLTVIIHYTFTDRRPMPLSFFTFDILIISVWFLVLNGIYIGMHFYQEWRNAENRRVAENKIKTDSLKVKSGKQELLLPYTAIAGFSVDGEYVICFGMDGKKFLLDQSMDKLEKALPPSWFFRLNRQSLVNRQVISGFEKAENGKLNVLTRDFPAGTAPITVSRIRAAAFKNWFDVKS